MEKLFEYAVAALNTHTDGDPETPCFDKTSFKRGLSQKLAEHIDSIKDSVFKSEEVSPAEVNLDDKTKRAGIIGGVQGIVDLFEDNEWEEFIKKFHLKKVIGSGGFGVVVQAVDQQHGKTVALKIAMKGNKREEMLLREYNILKECMHPNIIKIYSLTNYRNFLIISMKVCQQSVDDLAKSRREQGNPLDEEEVSEIAKGLLQGMHYLHEEKNIIHRDIKAQNLMCINGKELSKCQIIDFGLATFNKKDDLEVYGEAGTLLY